MKVIMISGKSESGKDTFAMALEEQMIEKNPNLRIMTIHFGDLVKYFAKAYYWWDGQKDERGRSLLQRLGTDTVRNKFPHYWGTAVSKFIAAVADDWDYVLIPDLRFISEGKDVMKFNPNTITVRIDRFNEDGTPYQNKLTEEQRQHPSECEYDDIVCDYWVRNDGNLDDLDIAARELIELMEDKDGNIL